MNIKKDSYFITFIALLILNMLLIFFGLYSYFFNVSDYTLIAGIIAFIGAIIGGIITYAGVRLTILNEKNKETIREAKTDYINLHHLLKLVENHTYNMSFMYFEDHVPLIELLKDFREALSVDGDIYKISIQLPDIYPYLMRIDSLVELISERFYRDGEIEDKTDSDLYFDIMKLYGELEQKIYEKLKETENILGYEWSKM